MYQLLKTIKNLFITTNDHYLTVDFESYKKWWLIIKIIVIFKFKYKSCLFFRKQYKFHKNLVVVGYKYSDKKLRRRTKGYSKNFLEKNSDANCPYCETKLTKENSSADHIIPISKGGNNSQLNLIVVCKDCNNERGDFDFLNYLRIKNSKCREQKYPFV